MGYGQYLRHKGDQEKFTASLLQEVYPGVRIEREPHSISDNHCQMAILDMLIAFPDLPIAVFLEVTMLPVDALDRGNKDKQHDVVEYYVQNHPGFAALFFYSGNYTTSTGLYRSLTILEKLASQSIQPEVAQSVVNTIALTSPRRVAHFNQINKKQLHSQVVQQFSYRSSHP